MTGLHVDRYEYAGTQVQQRTTAAADTRLGHARRHVEQDRGKTGAAFSRDGGGSARPWLQRQQRTGHANKIRPAR